MTCKPTNVRPKRERGGGRPYICGAFHFLGEFLVKILTTRPEKLAKSDQIPPT